MRTTILLALALTAAQPPRTDSRGDVLPPGAVARLGSVRFHHPGGTVAAAFAPDGKTVVVVGNDPKGLAFCFWDTATGKDLGRFTVAENFVNSLTFTPDG